MNQSLIRGARKPVDEPNQSVGNEGSFCLGRCKGVPAERAIELKSEV